MKIKKDLATNKKQIEVFNNLEKTLAEKFMEKSNEIKKLKESKGETKTENWKNKEDFWFFFKTLKKKTNMKR